MLRQAQHDSNSGFSDIILSKTQGSRDYANIL